MKLPVFLTFHKPRCVAAAALAALALAVFTVFYDWQTGLVFAGAFLAFCLSPRLHHPAARFLLNALWGIVCIAVSCALPTKMVSDSSFLSIGYYRIVMNFLCAAIVYGLCLVLTGEIRSAVTLASGLLLLLATVNGFIFQFRGNEFKPTDIFAARTALNVASQYSFRVPSGMAECWFVWLWMNFVMWGLPKADGWLPRLWLRLGALAAAAACFGLLMYGCRDIHPNNWSNGGSVENGYYMNFAVGIRDAIIEKPEGYSGETIAALEAAFHTDEPLPETMPNILVIMNESFADFNHLGTPLRANRTVTPFIDALEENTIRGYALTSIFGGVTANAEFELLTGSSMAFLPEGSVPYQQYLHGNTFSLAHVLEQLGYATFATHPYFSNGWSRTQVYPWLGFSRMTFDEDYPGTDRVREFISDREMYTYVLDALEEEREQPLFLFGITMQNHGDYIYTGSNYEQTVFLEGYDQEFPMAEQYLSLLHESDKAVEELLTALADYPEDTIVLFFGDHYPHVESSFFEALHGGEFGTLSEKMLQYTVPFFIWANFDIPEQTVACTSLNYLPRYLLETAELPLPAYYRFLAQLEEVIPAVNALGYYSVSEQTYLPLRKAQGEEKLWLDRYEILQYNSLFDNGSSDVFFGRYLEEIP